MVLKIVLATCPVDGGKAHYYSFEFAIALIVNAFSGFDQEMADFAQMMCDKGWIDAKPSENRETGGYCYEYMLQRESRIFMTWDGSIADVVVLAHEIGHAWHNWVMRDLCLLESEYPYNLAETASTFAEMLVRDVLYTQAQSDSERMQIAWEDAQAASSFLIDIASRFEFECSLVEARQNGLVPAEDLSRLMEEAWGKWYEDAMGEYDSMFWASKSHFSISGLGFYNYPYLFGYLFSMGIYAPEGKTRGEVPSIVCRIATRHWTHVSGRSYSKALGQRYS